MSEKLYDLVAHDIASRTRWEVRQGLWYQMRNDGLRRRGKPWPNAADAHFPLIDATINKLKPSFFVHTGDIVYYDGLAKSKELAHWHWQRMYSLPTNVDFHTKVASYFIKDDHDTWTNDCWPSMNTKSMFQFTYEQGHKIFPQQVPMGKSTYRTVRWGKD